MPTICTPRVIVPKSATSLALRDLHGGLAVALHADDGPLGGHVVGALRVPEEHHHDVALRELRFHLALAREVGPAGCFLAARRRRAPSRSRGRPSRSATSRSPSLRDGGPRVRRGLFARAGGLGRRGGRAPGLRGGRHAGRRRRPLGLRGPAPSSIRAGGRCSARSPPRRGPWRPRSSGPRRPGRSRGRPATAIRRPFPGRRRGRGARGAGRGGRAEEGRTRRPA